MNFFKSKKVIISIILLLIPTIYIWFSVNINKLPLDKSIMKTFDFAGVCLSFLFGIYILYLFYYWVVYMWLYKPFYKFVILPLLIKFRLKQEKNPFYYNVLRFRHEFIIDRDEYFKKNNKELQKEEEKYLKEFELDRQKYLKTLEEDNKKGKEILIKEFKENNQLVSSIKNNYFYYSFYKINKKHFINNCDELISENTYLYFSDTERYIYFYFLFFILIFIYIPSKYSDYAIFILVILPWILAFLANYLWVKLNKYILWKIKLKILK